VSKLLGLLHVCHRSALESVWLLSAEVSLAGYIHSCWCTVYSVQRTAKCRFHISDNIWRDSRTRSITRCQMFVTRQPHYLADYALKNETQ